MSRSRSSRKPSAAQPPAAAASRSASSGQPAGAPPRAEWAQVAQWYDQHVGDEGGEYHRQVILPGVLRMLGQVRSQPAPGAAGSPRVLDLACGQGVFCRRLAASGYAAVGVDIAAPLIEAARARGAPPGAEIPYVVADAAQLPVGAGPLQPGSFAAATIILAVQNLARLSPVWRSVRELLVPGGCLILVMMHPCFRIPQQSHWEWDGLRGVQLRTIEGYLSSTQKTIETHPGKAAAGEGSPSTTHYHRPLQAYINTLGTAGLFVDHIEEWPSHKSDAPGPKQAELNRSRREIPLFLALRALRLERPGQARTEAPTETPGGGSIF